MSSRIISSLLALVVFILPSVSHADDLDILNSAKMTHTNVLFVMDLSGSMDYQSGSSSETRLEVLSGAFQNIIADEEFDLVNIGLATFSGGGQGSRGKNVAHGITYPISPIIGKDAQDILNKTGFTHPSNSYMPDAGSNDSRQYLSLLSSDSNIWDADGSTPIVDALYEASLYFRAEDVDYGRFDASDIRSAHPSTYDGTLTLTSTTTTPACTVDTRVSCSKGSCGSTESCSTNTEMVYSATDTGAGCTTNTGNTQWCGSQPSCGLGTNCTTSSSTYTRFCNGSGDVSACETSNPTWYACTTYTNTSTTTNSEGQSVTTSSPGVRCSEDVSWTRCDAADTYSCPQEVERCNKCPDDVTTTELTGTATYKSPIIEECAGNAIILLTDGAPTANNSADKVAGMIGAYANGCNAGSEDGRCGPELAKFMATEDHADGSSTSLPNIDGVQKVNTYAVGLNLDVSIPEEAAAITFLNEVAMNGSGGPAIIAGNKAELTKAFKDAINDVIGKARSFSSPSYSIDNTTLLDNGAYVYIPVFDRSATLWPGNLKKYKLINGVLSDADDNPALDADGALLPSARDLWSDDPSSDVILSGGAANKITPSTRNMKTDNGTSLIDISNSIDNSEFGLSSSAADTNYKADLVTFISGLNPSDSSPRNHMGDIIHSKPVQLELAGGRKIIFVGSNEGYLHAINDYPTESDSKNGTEAFAYMPKELLKNIKKQYEATPLPNHIYGVDGLITVWIDESNNSTLSEVGNKIVDVSSGEKAYVFFGLRRGGGTYTALEVTDPDNPRLVWSNSFGNGNSWSQPVVANLKWKPNTTEKPVIVIGGGFNDDASGNEVAGGNNVYVINALTGDIVWDTSVAFSNSRVTNFSGSELPKAVPARIRVIDIDRNNSIDRLYFGDTGANIWRVDLNAANYDAITSNDNDLSKAKLHRFAALGGTGVNDLKFFEEPDVAIFKNGGGLVSSIAIGSGDRPNPLDILIEDQFFVLYDKEVLILPTEPLVTLASGNIKTVPVSKSDANDPNYKGWKKSLDSSKGEKVLSSAITFQGKILFTSFAVNSIDPDACHPSNVNENNVYVIDLFAGSQDAVFTHPGGEILGTPGIRYPQTTACEMGNCKREPKISFGRQIVDFPAPLAANGDPILDADGNPASGGGNTIERVYWIDSEK